MPILKTGSLRIKATIQTMLLLNEGETLNDPVADAKQKAVQAQDEADGMEQAQQRSDANVQADQFRKEAQARTEAAGGYKSNSVQGKKAHAIAALAHSDAQKAYTKQAAVASGNSLETRAKSQKLADEHSKMCDHHEQMAQGSLLGKGTLNEAKKCGSKTTLVNISRPRTDTDNQTQNTWSDAAREASIEARRQSSRATTPTQHTTASIAHTEAAQMHRYMAGQNPALSGLHEKAAEEHEAEAKNEAALGQGEKPYRVTSGGYDIGKYATYDEASKAMGSAAGGPESAGGVNGAMVGLFKHGQLQESRYMGLNAEGRKEMAKAMETGSKRVMATSCLPSQK